MHKIEVKNLADAINNVRLAMHIDGIADVSEIMTKENLELCLEQEKTDIEMLLKYQGPDREAFDSLIIRKRIFVKMIEDKLNAQD